MAESTGMLLGKFMPPHLGHRYLVDFARAYCEHLTILVCTLDSEPISGSLRYDWMLRMFPDCDVVHVTDDLPQEPGDAHDFWDQWRTTIRARIPHDLDFVFASEEYGARLADELGAVFVPVDVGRELVPVSGSAIRADPMGNWRYLPPEVRAHFVRRVCVFGPESTGKTTLARRLAEHFETVWVHEYARPLLDRKGGVCEFSDMEPIARAQRAAEDALAYQANRVLITDTDVLTTKIWSEELFGRVPERVEALAARQYDLTLLCDIDVPHVGDLQRPRGAPSQRQAFMTRCQAALETHSRSYVKISGDWPERWETAVAAVGALIQ